MISVAAMWPRKLLYGVDALDQLGTELARFGAKKAVLATDAYIATSDGAKKVRQTAKNRGIELSIFDQVEANSSEGTIHTLAREISENKCRIIIAIGGGNIIDCAKAANLVASHGGSISDYRGSRGIADGLFPLIAIPTTAGTGSEVSPVAMVTDVDKRTKYAVSGQPLIPAVAILDPVLTVSMSPQLTAWTGMDALSRAIEAYSSPVDSPIASSLAIDAVERIAYHLPIALRSGATLQARSEMMLAASMAGIASAQNQLGLVHALSRQVSAEFGMAQSLASAILLPGIMRFNKEFVQGRYAKIAAAMGARIRNLTASQAAEKAIQAVREQSAAAGIPEKIEGIEANDEVIFRMAANAMADPLTTLNPRPVTAHDMQFLLQQVV